MLWYWKEEARMIFGPDNAKKGGGSVPLDLPCILIRAACCCGSFSSREKKKKMMIVHNYY